MGRYSIQGVASEILDRCLDVAAAKPANRAPRPAPRRLKDKLSDSDRAAIVVAYVAGAASIATLALSGTASVTTRSDWFSARLTSGRSVGPRLRDNIRELRSCGVSASPWMRSLPS